MLMYLALIALAALVERTGFVCLSLLELRVLLAKKQHRPTGLVLL